MPNKHTFDIKPIGEFVRGYLSQSRVSIDPFSSNKKLCTYNNDLAFDGIDAEEFCKLIHDQKIVVDLALFDPPYSPRQMSECYKSVGLEVGMKQTQNGALYSRVRNALLPCLSSDSIVLSFGWNSGGMGEKHGFEIIEIMLCCHGGGHNDTICLAERRVR